MKLRNLETLLCVLGLSSVCILTSCDKKLNVQVADVLLNKFARSCRSHGSWASTALSHTQDLQEVLTGIKNRNECRGVEGILATVQSLSKEIDRLTTRPEELSVLEAEERKRRLLIALTQPGLDPTFQTQLQQEVIKSEFTLIDAHSRWEIAQRDDHNTREVRGLTQLNAYLQALFAAEGNLAACAQDNPLLAAQLAGSTLAIAGAFMNPALGPALVMTGQTFHGLMSLSRNLNIEDALRKVRTELMHEAVACGLETMADTYCEAHDLLVLAELNGQWHPTDPRDEESSDLLRGLDLWKYKVPDLMEWLKSLSTGVDPQDRFAANRQNEARQDYFKLQQVFASFHGLANEIKETVQRTPQDQVERVLRRSLNQIIEIFYSGESAPIPKFFSNPNVIVYRMAQNKFPPEDTQKIRGPDTIEFIPSDLTFEAIETRAEGILNEVSDLVLRRLNLVLDQDAAFLISEAFHPKAVGHWSPMEVIDQLLDFLNRSETFFTHLGQEEDESDAEAIEAHPTLTRIQETRQLLTELKTAIESLDSTTPDTETDSTTRAQAIIENLYQKFHLIYGDSFISKRIARLIRWDLESRIRYGQVSEQTDRILRIFSTNALQVLGTSQGRNRDYFMMQLQTAKRTSLSNIFNFAQEIFPKAIQQSLETLSVQAKRYREPLTGDRAVSLLQRPNYTMLARLCTLLLALPDWPPGVDLNYCLAPHIYLTSTYHAVPSLLFQEQFQGLMNHPQEERVCTYRNFMQKGQLLDTPRSLLR